MSRLGAVDCAVDPRRVFCPPRLLRQASQPGRASSSRGRVRGHVAVILESPALGSRALSSTMPLISCSTRSTVPSA
ncbi:hypothetical protein trd_A0427 (plasmid) [Thermomicrobium roseum DSM 5159]|uniref:Uncharacterized protein n=1 Tax=Thermomicrobium roseum (strain ATCC 27502 / DSM 5159 / P-2) TaxID=309801 RepID=B9L3R3_THERP|nr:hypothetical protein trd_A0427 [Thermomicrobium roseum DSM 5159]